MKAYLAIKYHADFANRNRIEGLLAVLENIGYQTFCAVKDLEGWGTISHTPDVLMRKSFELIDDCDVMVVDLTEKGVGVGIEAGYAFAKNKPIITIAQNGSPISETLRGISSLITTYEHLSDLKKFTVPFIGNE
jgi:nucleoside 2-deoxyribosyltransferase